MIKRFYRINDEFGTGDLVRILLLLIGLLFMTLLDVFYFSSYFSLIIALGGLIVGFLLKNTIPNGAEYYPRIITVGLFLYGIVLFLGDRFGFENHIKLAIITATTVLIFNLQFWTLSHHSIINKEKHKID